MSDNEKLDEGTGQAVDFERVVMCEESAQCTLCAKIESPGFYTGCMCKDLGSQNGWNCDGNGNLTRCDT